jgi:hypothetical protein
MALEDKLKIAYVGVDEEWAAVTGEHIAFIPAANTQADAVVTRALDTATRVNSAGNIETVVANKARIDYSLGTDKCPNLLVERNNGNIFTVGSDDLTGTNLNGLTPTLNSHISPKGDNTAIMLSTEVDASPIRHRIIYASSFNAVAGFYVLSVYVKQAAHRYIQLCPVASYASIDDWANFDLQTGQVTLAGTGAIAWSTPANHGYWRLFLLIRSSTLSSTFSDIITIINNNPLSGRYPSYQSTVAENVCYAWGINLTPGVVPLSYSSNGVKNADVIKKTGIGSLIPQTKGTLLFDGYLQAGSLSDGISRFCCNIGVDTNNSIYFRRSDNAMNLISTNGGVVQSSLTSILISPFRNKRIKLLGHYEVDKYEFYINGQKVGEDFLGTLPTLSTIFVGCHANEISQWDSLIKMAGVAEELTPTERDQFFQYDSLEIMAGEMQYQFES